MNVFEQKQEDKRSYYAEKAVKMRSFAENYRGMQKSITDRIPMGQPILVGHHSEKKHRRDIDRLHRYTDKAIEYDKKAQYYEEKAANYGKHGISSDDPEAVIKLKEKLARLEEQRELMKRVNKAYRAYKKNPESVETADLSDKMKHLVKTWKPEYSFQKAPFTGWPLNNLSGNIKNVKDRIETLMKQQARSDKAICEEQENYTYKEEDNRVQFLFEGKPDVEIRTLLKKNGFKWSPSRGAWVRMLNNASIYASERVKEKLKTVTGG
jgi:hypothetical protein